MSFVITHCLCVVCFNSIKYVQILVSAWILRVSLNNAVIVNSVNK